MNTLKADREFLLLSREYCAKNMGLSLEKYVALEEGQLGSEEEHTLLCKWYGETQPLDCPDSLSFYDYDFCDDDMEEILCLKRFQREISQAKRLTRV